MAYMEAILGTDHQVDGAIQRSQAYLKRALATGESDTEYRVAATLLLALHAKQYDQGIAEFNRVTNAGGSATLIELEGFRLLNAAKPGDKDTQRQLARLTQSLVFHARAFKTLGWYHYRQENWRKADQNFDEAQKNSRDHPEALLGQAMTDLDRNIGIEERQKEIGERVKKVLCATQG